MLSSEGGKNAVQLREDEACINVVVLKDIVEDLEGMLKERFEYLNIPADVKCITGKRLYQLIIKSNDVFTVMRSKKIVESMLPDSRVIIESIGGIPYDGSEDEGLSSQTLPSQS